MTSIRKKVKPVTLKDIAEKTGMSVATVSQVLNGKNKQNYTSEAKKALIRQTAKELNYQPSFAYKLMQGQETNTIAIVVSSERSFLEEHIQQMVLTLGNVLQEKDYFSYITYMTGENNVDKINNLINRGSRQFIFFGSPVDFEVIEKILLSKSLNYIGMQSRFQRNVSIDVKSGCISQLEHFLKKGKDRFVFCLPGETLDEVDGRRLAALKSVHKKHKLPKPIDRYVHTASLTRNVTSLKQYEQWGYDQAKWIIENLGGTQAIAYLSDYFVLGGIRYLKEQGIECGDGPDEILLAGFNNINAIRLGSYDVLTADHGSENVLKSIVSNLSNTKEDNFSIKPEVLLC